MPGGNCDVNVQGASKKKNQGNIFNRSSPMKITRICKGMTLDQKSVIINADFGSMLGMKISKLIPELCRFLMGCFNPITCELDFGDRGKIPINTESVVKVMGVPEGSTPVPYHRDSDATRVVLQMLGIEGKQPSLTMIEKKLGRSEPADDVYLVKFMIFLVSSLFAPTTATVVSSKCYPSLINTADIKNLKWATFIIDVIIQTANAKDNKNWFKACMPYLMVLYVDSLETNALDVPIDGTRICIWTNKMVRLIADLDTNSDGTFGKLPLKHCYRNKISLFSADPSAVDTFIKCHAPREHDEKDIAKYRGAVIEMCTVFEEGLARFIKSLSSEAAKDIEPKQTDAVLNAYKPKTRWTRRRTNAAVKVPVVDEEVALADEEVPIADDKVAVADEEVPVAEDKVAIADEEVHVADVKVQGVLSIAEEEMVISVPESKENKRKISDEVFDHERACKNVCIDAQQATEEGNVCEKDTITNRSASSVENKEPYPEMSHDLRSPVDPLKLLLCYGSGAQSIDSTVQNALVTSHHQADAPSSILKKQLGGRKKSVSFATDARNECGSSIVQTSPAVRRPLTRSMSPKKTPFVQKECAPLMENTEMDAEPTKPYPSSRRLTRVAVVEATEECNKGVLPVKNLVGLQVNNNMMHKLEPDFLAAENQIETEQQRKLRELMDDCPSFGLGFDETTTKSTECTTKEKETVASVDEIVIISSTKDSGDSLDKIYATIEMSSTAASSEKCLTSEKCHDQKKAAPSRSTPVPKQRRIVKLGPQQKSPFVINLKKPYVPKSDTEIYNKVCTYGGRSKHSLNNETIIDNGDFFINLRDLANSVKPGGWISNSTCEIALRVLSTEMANEKKCVMPLRIATKLRSATCIVDRTMRKAFECSPTNRLDHKDLILFSVLQDLTPNSKDMIGHYYLIVLNLKAGRFEVMDSLRAEGNHGLMADARTIIGSIKHLWSANYNQSKINISRYQTVYIPTPMQATPDDCGYFVLKFIESWNGIRMLPFNPSDMPVLRKLYLKKWVDHVNNKIDWQELLF